MKLNITFEGFRDYMAVHVSQTLKNIDIYQTVCESEWDVIKDYIGNPKTILELGCGLGRMSVYINGMLDDDSIKYILADSNGSPHGKIKFGWNPPKQRYYNNLEMTRKFCDMNGLNNYEIVNLKQIKSQVLSVDFVMSFLSVGFHYPIESYMDWLLKILNEGGNMIFGVRKNKYSDHKFEKYFNKCIIIAQDGSVEDKEDILILIDKKKNLF